MGLIRNRIIIERIAKLLFEDFIKEDAGTRMCGELIQRLRKDAQAMPRNMLSLMETVTSLGNLAAHDQGKHESHAVIGLTEFAVSFNAMTRILEWFFAERNARP